MSNISTIDLCRECLFDPEADVVARYGRGAADRVMRARAMYNWRMANPAATDRQFVSEFNSRFPMGKNAAREYLKVVDTLLPALSDQSRDFCRWRTNEMLLEAYQMAKARKDAKTMERAATSLGRLNRIDETEQAKVPYHLLMVQPFVPTFDPSVLGITPVPGIEEKIDRLLAKYTSELVDIEDVDFEEADLEEDELFAPYEESDEDSEAAGIF